MKDYIYQILQRKSLRILSCLVAFSLSTVAFAQDEDENFDDFAGLQAPKRQIAADKNKTVTIKGIVVDEISKSPVVGARLQVLGDKRYAAMTDDKGEFTMKVPTFATSLFVQAPRFSDQQVAIRANDVNQYVRVVMISDNFSPMYVDGTTYTAQKSLTSNGHGLTIDEQISAGLGGEVRTIMRSGQPDAGAAMFIRGLNSLNSTSQPLIVVDGVEVDMQQNRATIHDGHSLNLLANYTTQDIEKVTILKNATALYGARGGNGVILIETKRGHSMATRIDADLSVGYTLIPTLAKVMNASNYRMYATEMIGTLNVMKEKPYSSFSFNYLNDDPTNYYYRTYHNDTDWSDYTYREALTQNYSINVQGGDEIGMYNLSVGYADAQSVAEKNSFDRLNIRFNSDIKILYNLKTKFDMSLSRFNNKVFDTAIPADLNAGTITSPTFLSYIKAPFLYPYQYNANIGTFSELLANEDETFAELGENYSLANPMAILANGSGDNKNKNEHTYFNVLLAPTYEFNSNLSLTAMFSYTLNRNSQRYYRPYTGVPSFTIEEIGETTAKVSSMFAMESNVIANAHLDWNKKYGAHSIAAYGGFRFNSFTYDSNVLSTQYKTEVNDKNPKLSTTGFVEVGGANDVWRKFQWYANADYNFMNRYFVTATAVAEANSRFGENCSGPKIAGTHWAIFPSLQLGWIVSNENWFPKNSGINYLRVNAGFDISGNDDISNYAARTSFSTIKYGNNIAGAQLTNVGNDKITWETTTKWNYGLEANMLNNRLSLAFDYFYHETKDLLTIKSFTSPIGGINNYWSNGGKLANKGYEATVSVKPVSAKDLTLEVGASVGHYDNKLLELPSKPFTDGEKAFSDGTYMSSVYGQNNILTAVGNPIGLFYGYQTNGVYASTAEAQGEKTGKVHLNKDGYTTTNLYMIDYTGGKIDFEAGDVRFVDQNEDGCIDENDKVVIGNPNPDFYGNIFATLTWKRFTLGTQFNYSVGNDVYNYQNAVLMAGSNFSYNQSGEMINRWRYEGQVTTVPRAIVDDPRGNGRFSDRWIEDGSYIRLKNVTLTYRIPIPESWTSWLQGISVWGEATNVFTLTRYTGADPEFSNGNGVLYQGIDAGNIAHSRHFTLGLKINL